HHRRRLALTAQEHPGAVQDTKEGCAPQAHTTAPVIPSAEARLVTPTRNAATSTIMTRRRMNSLISPPNTRAAPHATMASSEMVKATGPVMSVFKVVSGVSHGR